MSRLLGSRLCTYVGLCVLWLMAANGRPQGQFGIDEMSSGSSAPQVDGVILPYDDVQPRSPQLQGTQMAQSKPPQIGNRVSGHLYIFELATGKTVGCLNAKGETIPFPSGNRRGCSKFGFSIKNQKGVLKTGSNMCGVAGTALRCGSSNQRNDVLTTFVDSGPPRVAYTYENPKIPGRTEISQAWIFYGNPSEAKDLSPHVTTPEADQGFYLVFVQPPWRFPFFW